METSYDEDEKSYSVKEYRHLNPQHTNNHLVIHFDYLYHLAIPLVLFQ